MSDYVSFITDIGVVLISPHLFATLLGILSFAYAPFVLNSAENPGKFAMFTEVLPNQLKIIEWGGTFIRVICVNPGYAFKVWVDSGGKSLPSKDNFGGWVVVERPKDCPTMPEVVPGSIFSGSVAKWLSPLFVFRFVSFKITGLHFFGIAPYVQVRSQDYKRAKVPGSGKISLDTVVQVVDRTDHFRIGPFTNYVVSGELPTQQGWSVSVLMALELSITDAPSAAYSVDRWDQNIPQRVVAAVAEAMHGASIDAVYGGGDVTHKSTIINNCWRFLTGISQADREANSSRFIRAVADLGGINIHNIRVVDMNADEGSRSAVERALAAPFAGKKEGEGTKNRLTAEGEGRQAFISNQLAGVSKDLTPDQRLLVALQIIDGESLRGAVAGGGAKVIATFGSSQQRRGEEPKNPPLSLPQFLAASQGNTGEES